VKKIILFLVLSTVLSFNSGATVIYVDSINTGGYQDGTEWAYAFSSIQGALSAAVAGDSIWVAKGIYQPAVSTPFHLKDSVKIFGGFLNTHTSFSQRNPQLYTTSLKGNGTKGIIRNTELDYITPATLVDGFTFSEGLYEEQTTAANLYTTGGAIYLDNASPSINNCIFENNKSVCSSTGGGAIASFNGSPIITNCTFINNTCMSRDLSTFGSGGSGGALMMYYATNAIIKNCVFTDNKALAFTTVQAQNGMAHGGAIQANGGTYTLDSCTFTNNVANGDGGAIFTYGISKINVTHCTFNGNYATNKSSFITYGDLSLCHGGVIASYATTYLPTAGLFINNCTFSGNYLVNNVVDNSNRWAHGGVIYANNYSNVKVNNSTFSDNYISFTNPGSSTPGFELRGGVIYNQSPYMEIQGCSFSNTRLKITGTLPLPNVPIAHGGAIYSISPLLISQCTFTNNKAKRGGAIYFEFLNDTAKINNCRFVADSAQTGGAVFNASKATKMQNCLFAKNVADSLGAAVYNDHTFLPTINCTFAQNNALMGGSAIYNGANSTVQLVNSIIWGNNSGIFTDGSSVTTAAYSLVQGYPANVPNHNLAGTTNPLFVDTAIGNYRLLSTSNCIDAGNNASNNTTTDLDNYTRINGTAIDLGGFESGNMPLGVKFITFSAYRRSDKSVHLEWTANCDGMTNYELQKSLDGVHYRSIYTIKEKSAGEHSHDYSDLNLSAINYYRVQAKEMGADPVYSSVALIKDYNLNETKVYPNPTTDYVNITFGENYGSKVECRLLDIYGRTLLKLTLSGKSGIVSLSQFPCGVYFLRIGNETFKLRKN
jgi:predicted outer membrane repeat protein